MEHESNRAHRLYSETGLEKRITFTLSEKAYQIKIAPNIFVFTHLRLVSRLRMSGVLHLLSLYALLAWAETTLPLSLTTEFT